MSTANDYLFFLLHSSIFNSFVVFPSWIFFFVVLLLRSSTVDPQSSALLSGCGVHGARSFNLLPSGATLFFVSSGVVYLLFLLQNATSLEVALGDPRMGAEPVGI